MVIKKRAVLDTLDILDTSLIKFLIKNPRVRKVSGTHVQNVPNVQIEIYPYF